MSIRESLHIILKCSPKGEGFHPSQVLEIKFTILKCLQKSNCIVKIILAKWLIVFFFGGRK